MKLSQLLMNTRRETPAEAETPSHALMLRASLIRQTASGVYAYLPLGVRVLRKIERIVREEMDSAGAQEVLMPALLPASIYQASGRWEIFGEEMFRLKDRGGREYCLGPTHEEPFTETLKETMRSYKSLPVTLYQIQTKYRDELRPRFGVIRSREFVMKDAYSFDLDEAGLDRSYRKMYDAYRRIFDRLGLRYLAVDADTGAMGGSGSQEFVVPNDFGEDTVVCCASCGYAANLEKAAGSSPVDTPAAPSSALEAVKTPGVHTIDEVCAFFGCEAPQTAKTILYLADGSPVAAVVRGDREVSENKLKALLGVSSLTLADADTVKTVTRAEVGFAGPVGLDIPIYADYELLKADALITGANRTDTHFTGTNARRDMSGATFADLRCAADGDVCPRCGKPLKIVRGIEIGHIFKLGTKYTKALGCACPDAAGKELFPVMGCYGIGISRLAAAVIEQYHDDAGICWPLAAAPYQAIVTPVGAAGGAAFAAAEEICRRLISLHVETLFDDREESAGVKFKDADLLGIPIRITVGRKAADGVAELRLRADLSVRELRFDEAVDFTRRFCGL